jgi:hypothetical protein
MLFGRKGTPSGFRRRHAMRIDPPRRGRFRALSLSVGAVALVGATHATYGALADPIPEKIQAGSVPVRLNRIASGNVGTPIDLEDPNDGSGRLFVVD